MTEEVEVMIIGGGQAGLAPHFVRLEFRGDRVRSRSDALDGGVAKSDVGGFENSAERIGHLPGFDRPH